MPRPEVHKVKRPDRKADIAKDMARLRGRSDASLARDDQRMSMSPLGGAMKRKEQQRRGP
jgi:hypothetical protein